MKHLKRRGYLRLILKSSMLLKRPINTPKVCTNVTVKDLYVVFTPNSRKFRQAHLRFHSL
jgi:hypothetical protein